jgi:hypothetical protein
VLQISINHGVLFRTSGYNDEVSIQKTSIYIAKKFVLDGGGLPA